MTLPKPSRWNPLTWMVCGSAVLIVWTVVSIALLATQPVQSVRAPKLVEKLESVAFYMMEALEDQGARPDRKYDAVSARSRVDQIYSLYQQPMPAISAAAVGIPELEESLTRAHEWMSRVNKARLSVQDPIKEEECRVLEAAWRANAAQAVVELRMAVVSLRSAPIESLRAERKSRIAEHFPILGIGVGLAALAALGMARQRKPVAEPRASRAVNASLPSLVESAASVAVQHSGDAVITLDPLLRILGMNPAAEQLFGHRSADATGVNLNALVPSLGIRGEISEDATPQPGEQTAMHHNGTQLPIHLALHVSSRQGRRVVVAIAREVVAAPAPSGDASATVVADMADHCPAPLVIYDAEGRVIHFNPAFAEAMSASLEETQSRPYWRTFLEGEHAERARREWLVASVRLPDQVQQTWRALDGRTVPMKWARSAMRDEQGKVRFVVAIGVEETRRSLALAA